jgi:hypothetical protein
MDQIIGQSPLARVNPAEGEFDAADEALGRAERLSEKMKGYRYPQR